MDLYAEVALAAGLAWGSGLRFYAVVFLAGLGQRLGWVVLPGDLEMLASDALLGLSGVLLVGEFIADKVPAFDSVGDALHTAIRVPGGMALAFAALGDEGPALQIAAALLGGGIAAGTHVAKAGARVAINHSPEPFSNWTASFTEDGLALAGLWLAWQHPWVFLGLLALFLLGVAWLLPKLWRRLRGSVAALRRLLQGRRQGACT
jgi:hypothetical protein